MLTKELEMKEEERRLRLNAGEKFCRVRNQQEATSSYPNQIEIIPQENRSLVQNLPNAELQGRIQ